MGNARSSVDDSKKVTIRPEIIAFLLRKHAPCTPLRMKIEDAFTDDGQQLVFLYAALRPFTFVPEGAALNESLFSLPYNR